MNEIGKILVIIEPEHSESLALKRAKLIAGVTGAHLHLLVCDKKHEHSALLALLKEQLSADGYNVTTELAWNNNLHETIIGVQQAEGCALVIKQHYPDSPLKKALLTPADWKLLRLCPAAVLLVKTATPWTDGVILAAIDVGNLDNEHKDLHAAIIDHGFDMFTHPFNQLRTVGLHLIQFQLTDFRPHDARNGGGNRRVHIADAVDGLFRFGHPVEHAGFHLDQHVIGGDGVL